jgi:hypothetical protein
VVVRFYSHGIVLVRLQSCGSGILLLKRAFQIMNVPPNWQRWLPIDVPTIIADLETGSSLGLTGPTLQGPVLPHASQGVNKA